MKGEEGTRYKKSGNRGGDAVAFSWNLTNFSGVFPVEWGELSL
jgi:hypothetical protein